MAYSSRLLRQKFWNLVCCHAAETRIIFTWKKFPARIVTVFSLLVDQDGNIYLSSTTQALIYINGRELKMSATDVATMLKSLPPNAIASIEIMRTPSAKYDASGSGGIVNVVLKKGVKIGLTGASMHLLLNLYQIN